MELPPSIPQRTPEWYAAREKLITASVVADVLNANPYNKNARQQLLLQKSFPEQYRGPVNNVYMKHGTLYEPIATMIYEALHKKKVREVGLFVHPRIPFIGASPDGIMEDGSRMLEIKCPMKRKIKKKEGEEICPRHYWMQVQTQLEVCDMQLCDFWQCSFEEVDSLGAWMELDASLFKGMICELVDGTVVYPPHVEWAVVEYCKWVVSLVPVQRVIFWYLADSFNLTVERDQRWFQEEALPALREFWKEVEQRKAPSFFECFG